LRSNKAKAAAKSWRNTHRNRQASEDGEVKVGSASRKQQRIFLLSPANASGIRAQLILREQARFELAVRLRREGSPLGEVFSFISGLYFRGKLAYSRAFVAAPPAVGGAFVITSSRGLVSPETIARRLAGVAGDGCETVLLGSIASPKYVEPLLGIFGERLVFPLEFVGRGDMSRGGLMLRCVREGTQLTYVPVATAVRRSPRLAKLPNLARLRSDRSPGTEPWKR
jgi:hypothetical protein